MSIESIHSAKQTLNGIWKRLPRIDVVCLLLLMVGVGLTEGIGILLLVPLLSFLDGMNHSPVWISALPVTLERLGLLPSAGLLLGFFVVLVVFRSLVQYGRDELGTSLQFSVVDDLRKSCFDALLRVEWRWLCDKRQADHANLLLTDLARIGVGLHFGLGLLATCATGLAWVAAAFVLSWKMTWLALISGALVLWALSGQRRAAVSLGFSLGKANRSLQAEVQEALQGIRLTKILGIESRHLAYFVETVRDVRLQQQTFMRGTYRLRALTHVAGAAALAIFLYVGLLYGQVPVAQLLVLVMIFARLIPMLMSAQQQWHQCLHAWPALLDTQNLLRECALNQEPSVRPHDEELWEIHHEVRLDAVTVRYPGRELAALDRVSLVLPSKTTTAVIGESGSGKSTLADLIMGLLVADDGTVSVDGQALDATNRLNWRQSVAYVSQEVFLIHDTIRRNLLLACPQASEVECIKALKMAAAEFVFNLPNGLDTIVGDGGVRLSGGERQRIALARALLRRPSVLILDEATSALDTENEARIRQSIQAMHRHVTTLIIGHRLPTLEHADQVIRLKNGAVEASRTWSQVNGQLH
jgi:ATP-binding cassette subfamily C protein